jgi:hypothetical protein
MKFKKLFAGLVALPVIVAGCSCAKDGEYVEVDKMEAFTYINEVKSDNNFNMEGYNYVMEISVPDFTNEDSLSFITMTTEGAFTIGENGVEATLELSSSGIEDAATGEIYIKGNTIYINDGETKKYATIPVGEEDLYSFFYDGTSGEYNAIPSFEAQILATLEQIENSEDVDAYVMTKRKEGTTTYRLESELEEEGEGFSFGGIEIEVELTFKDDKLINASYSMDFAIMKVNISFSKLNEAISFPSFDEYQEDLSILDEYYVA